MADDITSGGFTVATDDSAGVHIQLVKLADGANGTRVVLDKAEDAAHASGDRGIMALAVRKDTAAAVAGTDGDYIPLIVDASGRLHVAVGSMPRAERETDSLSAYFTTGGLAVYTNADPDNPYEILTVKNKSITVAASQTDSSVIALVASKKLRVVAFSCSCAGTGTTLTLESDEGSDVRLHKIAMAANGGQTLGPNPWGWFETAAGSALIATTGAGSDVEITLNYVEAP